MGDEPRGVGEATFGMSAAEVKQKQFSSLTPLIGTQKELAYYSAGEKVSFDGIENCNGTLSFIADRFYLMGYKCPEAKDVAKKLGERFGEPTKKCDGKKGAQTWVGAKTTVTMSCSMNASFGISDNELSKEVAAKVAEQKAKMKGAAVKKKKENETEKK